jgi:Zn-dependent oligopeptidase
VVDILQDITLILGQTLDYNVYDWMKANGGLTRKNSERFRKYILSVE